ncbi:unnamed protein product, partial [marine sediment metagenome]
STINKNSTWLNVITDENAVCILYGDGCSINEPSPPAECDELVPENISTTNGIYHSKQITNLKDDFIYNITVDCEDDFGDRNIELLTFYVNSVEENCTIPTDDMIITQNTTFCPGTYNLHYAITIGADDVILDCNGALIKGAFLNGYGDEFTIKAYHRNNIKIKNCSISNTERGITFFNTSFSTISNNKIEKNNQGSIKIHYGNNNFIVDNFVNNPTSHAIETVHSHYNIIDNNKLMNSGYGIWIQD